ncbi:hypothetical protein TCAL_08086 [Tigriopus californicus]|uniref:Adenosine deaminase n=2 Tax=Tigriopus californicus TaxID=6832 RepID=A0A553PNX0_TIGCA|nr:hypothetical protein TCAL_08086 [Tigriopus californicus]
MANSWRLLGLLLLVLSDQISADFYSERAAVLEAEANTFMGSELTLSPNEERVNKLLMQMKHTELDSAFESSSYPPAQSLFVSKSEIEASNVFQFIQSLPKGGAIHTHDISIASIDWAIANLTYRDNLWACFDHGSLRFSWALNPDDQCTKWDSLADLRQDLGSEEVDYLIKRYLVINVPNPDEVYPDVNAVWEAFGSALGTVTTLISYEPAFRDYFRQALVEFHADNVQLLEVRTVLPDEVCKDLGPCNKLSQTEIAAIYQEVADEFLQGNPDSCGTHMIFAPTRGVTDETFSEYIPMAQTLMANHPGFFVGFDLVGQEDKGRPLIDYADALIAAKQSDPKLKYFLHAGETDWQGVSTDINIIDALLLNTTRIGHGYAIVKHPEAKRLARERDVPLEICPISNQVLGLVHDLRNHPGAVLIQEGFPLVISSDDPATWDLTGLSYDFYEAFMGMAGRDMDLRLLKKLVLNSVKYAGFVDETKRQQCQDLVMSKWDAFMDTFASSVDPEIQLIHK